MSANQAQQSTTETAATSAAASPRLSRTQAAKFITENYFPTSKRQLMTWPELHYQVIGCVALYEVEELKAAAERRLDDAPVLVHSENIPSQQRS